MNHEKDWRMPLTQYRKAEKYPKEVATYEQSVLALSRKMRNKSTPHCSRIDWSVANHISYTGCLGAEEDQEKQGVRMPRGSLGRTSTARGI